MGWLLTPLLFRFNQEKNFYVNENLERKVRKDLFLFNKNWKE